jgi:sulfur transfer complex TusBCD TusB component (DsrH family)
MKQILHILKDSNPSEALRIIEKQVSGGSKDIAILLIQDAVRINPSISIPIYILREDLESQGLTSKFESVNYERMLEMIFGAEKVIAW